MTTQQRDALNRFLAEKVMGWIGGDHPEKHGTGQWMSEYDWPVWFTGDGDEFIISDAFNPLENLADCEPLLDKIEQDGWCWSWLSSTRDYMVTVYRRDGDTRKKGVSEISTDRTEALTLAIARAYGYDHDEKK